MNNITIVNHFLKKLCNRTHSIITFIFRGRESIRTGTDDRNKKKITGGAVNVNTQT